MNENQTGVTTGGIASGNPAKCRAVPLSSEPEKPRDLLRKLDRFESESAKINHVTGSPTRSQRLLRAAHIIERERKHTLDEFEELGGGDVEGTRAVWDRLNEMAQVAEALRKMAGGEDEE